MNREMKRAIREVRLETYREEHERRIAEIHARAGARRAAHEQKLKDLHARIEARKAERSHRKTAEPAVKEEPAREIRNQGLQALKAAMMENVPTIHFPEDDPKYNSAREHKYL